MAGGGVPRTARRGCAVHPQALIKKRREKKKTRRVPAGEHGGGGCHTRAAGPAASGAPWRAVAAAGPPPRCRGAAAAAWRARLRPAVRAALPRAVGVAPPPRGGATPGGTRAGGGGPLEGGRRGFGPPARFRGHACAAARSPPASRPTTAATMDGRRGEARHTWCALSCAAAWQAANTVPVITLGPRFSERRGCHHPREAPSPCLSTPPPKQSRGAPHLGAQWLPEQGKGAYIQAIKLCLALQLYLPSSLFLHLSVCFFRISARVSRISSRCVWQLYDQLRQSNVTDVVVVGHLVLLPLLIHSRIATMGLPGTACGHGH